MSQDSPDWLPSGLDQLYGRLSPREREQLKKLFEGTGGSPPSAQVYALFAGRFNEHIPAFFDDVKRKLAEALEKDDLSKAMTEVWRLPLLIEARIHEIIDELPTRRQRTTLESE